jgi:hypothetical protein
MIRDEDELRSKRYRFSRDFTHALGRQLVPLIASELYNVCHEVPVLFAKSVRGWDVVGVVTDPALRRSLVSRDGAWLGGYSPFLLRIHPFRPAPDGEAWEVDPVGLAQARERGRPFYLPDGSPAPEFVTIKAMLADAAKGRAELRDHAARLERAGLITPVPMAFVAETMSQGLAALFCVDALRMVEAQPRLLASLAAGSPSALDLAFASIYSMRLLKGHYDAAALTDLEGRIADLMKGGAVPAPDVVPAAPPAAVTTGFALDRSDTLDYARLT